MCESPPWASFCTPFCTSFCTSRVDELKLNSDKTQFMWLGSRQQLAKIRDTVYTYWGSPHQILNLREESGSDFRSRTGNGPACQQHNKKLLLPAETAAIHPTIPLYGSLEDIGPFPRIKLCGLLQQHILRSHERCPTKIAIRSQRGGQADHEHKEI